MISGGLFLHSLNYKHLFLLMTLHTEGDLNLWSVCSTNTTDF